MSILMKRKKALATAGYFHKKTKKPCSCRTPYIQWYAVPYLLYTFLKYSLKTELAMKRKALKSPNCKEQFKPSVN